MEGISLAIHAIANWNVLSLVGFSWNTQSDRQCVCWCGGSSSVGLERMSGNLKCTLAKIAAYPLQFSGGA